MIFQRMVSKASLFAVVSGHAAVGFIQADTLLPKNGYWGGAQEWLLGG